MPRSKAYKAREAKRMELLRQVRDGEKYTKAWRVWAPLSQADLIEFETGYRVYAGAAEQCVKSVRLTAWGQTVLSVYEKEQKK